MCGILGIYGFNDKQTVKKAGKRLIHRGPDMFGHYVDKNVELFHRRLSIVDLSKKGRQPMISRNGRFVIVFNGEIYNFRTLRSAIDRNFNFSTGTDTEVILRLFEEEGIACINKLEGDFAFAIWDSKNKELVLARDRSGVKPLYYFKDGEKFILASEYKAIIPFIKKIEINKQALSDFMSWGFNPGDETFIKGVFALPPAHYCRLTRESFEIKKYWDIYSSKEKPENVPFLLKRSVNQRLMADVPLGVYLSGGLDSSSIVATLSESVKNLKTFSVGFESTEVLDETVFAEKVATMYKTDHKNIHLNDSYLKYWPKIAWHLDEPLSNLSVLPLYVMSREASKDVKVVLSGNGGDECFGGYRQHQLVYNAYKYSRVVPRSVLKFGGGLTSMFAKNKRISEFSEKFIRDAKDPEKSYSDLMFKDLDESEKKKLLGSGVKPSKRFIKLNKNRLLKDLKFIDYRYRAANNYLLADDKTNMANSVESRVPLFDHRLVGAAWKIKDKKQVSLFDKKIFLKKLMKDKLPKEILYRKKYGFTSPLRQWFNSKLDVYESKVYDSELFKKSKLDKWFENYKADNRKMNVIWSMINSAIWKETFLDSSGEKPIKSP